jgi:hypothetical protein
MRRFLKSIFKPLMIDILAAVGAFPTGLTSKQELRELISKLAPVNSGKKLLRLGPKGDGGYLVPDDLDGIEACFSPGVCLVSGFEKDCADRGIKVFMADRSVDQPAAMHELFHFTKKYVGVTTNEDFMTIDNWVSLSMPGSKSDLILQIDIEGYEYENILAMSDSLMNRYRIIVAEFHDLDQLWSYPFFRLASRALDKILQTHSCVHIHPNNIQPPLKKQGLSIPPSLEFTFLRNDRLTDRTYANIFPQPLDSDNSDKPHLVLPACWYKK